MILFHGGCHGCTQQEVNGLDFCVKCRYFDADWSLPNLSNQIDESDYVKISLKNKHSMPLSEREKFLLELINKQAEE